MPVARWCSQHCRASAYRPTYESPKTFDSGVFNPPRQRAERSQPLECDLFVHLRRYLRIARDWLRITEATTQKWAATLTNVI